MQLPLKWWKCVFCVCVWCVYPAAFSALFAHAFSAFVCSEPIHLLTLVSAAPCMTIQAIKSRVEHTVFNSYNKKNKSEEDEVFTFPWNEKRRRGKGEKKKRKKKVEWRADESPFHNSDSLPHGLWRHAKRMRSSQSLLGTIHQNLRAGELYTKEREKQVDPPQGIKGLHVYKS